MAEFVSIEGKPGYVRCVEDGSVIVDDPALRAAHSGAVAVKAQARKDFGGVRDAASLLAAQTKLIEAQQAALRAAEHQLAKAKAGK